MIRHADPFPTAAPFMPARLSLTTMRAAVENCRGCDLYKHATHAVFGEGRRNAVIMFIGEQPGDQEDLQGKPFVGPAGRMFDNVLEQVGIDRQDVYVTNAVKHFKFVARGKRRIHGKPNSREIRACRQWLEGEMEVVKPQMLIALGATAAMSLFGPAFRVSKQRGVAIASNWAPWCMATVHPSSLLRAPDEAARRLAKEEFLRDFKVIARQYKRITTTSRATR